MTSPTWNGFIPPWTFEKKLESWGITDIRPEK